MVVRGSWRSYSRGVLSRTGIFRIVGLRPQPQWRTSDRWVVGMRIDSAVDLWTSVYQLSFIILPSFGRSRLFPCGHWLSLRRWLILVGLLFLLVFFASFCVHVIDPFLRSGPSLPRWTFGYITCTGRRTTPPGQTTVDAT